MVRGGVGQRHGVLTVSSPAESLAEIMYRVDWHWPCLDDGLPKFFEPWDS